MDQETIKQLVYIAEQRRKELAKDDSDRTFMAFAIWAGAETWLRGFLPKEEE